MSDTAIRVENLSKLYHLGRRQQRNDTLRDELVGALRGLNPFGRKPGQSDEDLLWALKDVSFEVKPGEVLGIIGRNGAGKSTLLKILSRITEPTSGRAVLNGRVASLLEVGTGFHPELSGRENIYLNGAILGMQRSEIAAKFDEIVDFAEIEKFLDTPVKRYSSGMYVRLAFAVAAHLEPEILLVDEVLAVGDSAFQKKCMGKMGDVAKTGRTVLFVSHQMAAVQNLCERSLLLQEGGIASDGPTSEVTSQYTRNMDDVSTSDIRSIKRRDGDGRIRFTDFRILDQNLLPLKNAICGSDVVLDLAYSSIEPLKTQQVVMSVGFYNLLGQPLFLCRNDLSGNEYVGLPSRGKVFCHIPRFPLPPGSYRVNLYCEINGIIADWLRDSLQIIVMEGDFYGTGRLPSNMRGDLLVDHKWLPAVQTTDGEKE